MRSELSKIFGICGRVLSIVSILVSAVLTTFTLFTTLVAFMADIKNGVGLKALFLENFIYLSKHLLGVVAISFCGLVVSFILIAVSNKLEDKGEE